MKITPGTWDYELTEIDSGNPQRPLPGPMVVYATWTNDPSVDVCTLSAAPEMLGNARLIAAAPALYEALKDLLSVCDEGDGEAYTNAVAALKAATGESK